MSINEECKNGSPSMTRRDFLGVAGAATALVSCGAGELWKSSLLAAAQSKAPLGEWLEDENGLPCFRYSGPLSFQVKMKNGELVPLKTMAKGYSRPYLPDDPCFLLGNYRLTLFVHASGLFQILTGERAWGRMNQGDSSFSGSNHASIEIAGMRYELVGLAAPVAAAAEKLFGIGFACYRYRAVPSVDITRTISVRPSKRPGEGTPAFLVTVRLRNLGETALSAIYNEGIRARYEMIVDERSNVYDMISDERVNPRYQINYSAEVLREDSFAILRADFCSHPAHGVTFSPGHMSRLEGAPPSLFVKADGEEGIGLAAAKDSAGNNFISISSKVQLQPGGEKLLRFVVGYSRDRSPHAITAIAESAGLKTAINSAHQNSVFGKEWVDVVPVFNDEPDAILRREMRWDAAVLEAMATYRDYYDETAVPQGTLYDYVWGVWCVSRDFAQHGLPLCHTDPALARSILRFIMKRMLRDGEIKGEDMGYGWVWPGGQSSSDQQLYFFMLMAEYLRATKDASILTEEVAYFPAERSGKGTGLDRICEAFLFLREQIGTGDHGLVCIWRGDWNDQFYAEPGAARPDLVFWTAESHMNSAMLISVLGDLTAALDSTISSDRDAVLPKKQILELVRTMREYRKVILEAYLQDWGTRPFPRRAYLSNDQIVGEENMWLEPQGFTLQIAEVAPDGKRALWDEIRNRLLAGESQGCRQRETSSKGSEPWTSPGTRENGGFWYALEGPLVLGVATFDPAAAHDLLKRMTFAHFAERFPEYWTGHWSASDSLDSALVATEGLSYVPVYCAHAHAWPLYCYLRLREAGLSRRAAV